MTISTPTVGEVRAIITTDLIDAAVQGAIDDATLMAEHCVLSLNALRQKSIIKYLAAHLIASMTAGGAGGKGAANTLTQFALGDASETYARATTGEGIKGTTYGQQAIALDPNGCVANIGKQRACFKVL